MVDELNGRVLGQVDDKFEAIQLQLEKSLKQSTSFLSDLNHSNLPPDISGSSSDLRKQLKKLEGKMNSKFMGAVESLGELIKE